MKRVEAQESLRLLEWPGTGLCPQAQADGVPCEEPGRDCATCPFRVRGPKEPAES